MARRIIRGEKEMCCAIGTTFITATAAHTWKKLEKAGAFSPETAKKPEELGLPEKWLQLPGVKKTEDGRYYIERKDKKKHC